MIRKEIGKMKKNTMMRVASVLLLAVLLTTCAISGTFAKYTATGSGSDSARVAKWGFGTTTLTIDLFDGNYDNVANTTLDGKNLVAPGTTKTTSIDLIPSDQAAPEVAYSFTVSVSSGDSSSSDLLNKLVWYVDGTKCGTNGSFSEFQTVIASKSQTSVSANTLPTAQSLNVKWEWPFDGDDTTDTTLGNATTLAELSIEFSFTATQID